MPKTACGILIQAAKAATKAREPGTLCHHFEKAAEDLDYERPEGDCHTKVAVACKFPWGYSTKRDRRSIGRRTKATRAMAKELVAQGVSPGNAWIEASNSVYMGRRRFAKVAKPRRR